MAIDLSQHIAPFFNNQQFSDFLISNGSQKIYLHKLILSINPFFATWFSNKYKDANDITVDNFKSWYIVAQIIYTNKFDIKDIKYKVFTAESFINLVETIKMVFVNNNNYVNILFQYLYHNWKILVCDNFNIIPFLQLHFENITDFEWKETTQHGWEEIATKYLWNGDMFMINLIEFIVENKECITKEMLEWNIVKKLPQNILLTFFVKYDGVNYLMKMDSVNALPVNKQNLISHSSIELNPKKIRSKGNTFVITSITPLNGIIYTPIGKVVDIKNDNKNHQCLIDIKFFAGIIKNTVISMNMQEYIISENIKSTNPYCIMTNNEDCPAPNMLVYRIIRL